MKAITRQSGEVDFVLSQAETRRYRDWYAKFGQIEVYWEHEGKRAFAYMPMKKKHRDEYEATGSAEPVSLEDYSLG